MIKKEHIDSIEKWLDEGYERAREEKLCGTMLEILKQKDIVKKLKQVDEPIIVRHLIEEIKEVKPLTTKIRDFLIGSK